MRRIRGFARSPSHCFERGRGDPQSGGMPNSKSAAKRLPQLSPHAISSAAMVSAATAEPPRLAAGKPSKSAF